MNHVKWIQGLFTIQQLFSMIVWFNYETFYANFGIGVVLIERLIDVLMNEWMENIDNEYLWWE